MNHVHHGHRRLVALASVLAFVAAEPGLAQSNPAYSFAEIAKNAGSIAFTSAVVGDVNAYGVVAFAVNEPQSLRGVYIDSGVGPSIKVIDGSAGQHTNFWRPDINCVGHVVVRAAKAGGGEAILGWDGGAAFIIAADSNAGDPSINDHDEVAFVITGGSYQYLDGATLVGGSALNYSYTYSGYPGVAALHPACDINNNGVVAYGRIMTNGSQEIWITGGMPDCLVETLPASSFKNESSIVIQRQEFVGFFATPHFWIDQCNLGPKQMLVQNTQGIAYRSLDLNCWWTPSYGGGSSGGKVYAGSTQATDAIAWAGGTLPPSGLGITQIQHGGINNRGSVSMLAKLSDGSQRIVRADLLAPTADIEGCPGFAPGNDLIQNAISISEGSVSFTTVNATTDGPALDEMCEEGYGLSLEFDVWYAFVAPSSKRYAASTCNAADFDTRLAVYSTTPDGTPGELLACNDDSPNCPGFTSETQTFTAVAGEKYLVRVGGYSGWGDGLLTIAIKCNPDLNGDGVVDGGDLGALLSAFGAANPAADLDGSGLVDGGDVGLLLAAWGS